MEKSEISSSQLESSWHYPSSFTSVILCVISLYLVYRLVRSLREKKDDGRRYPPGPKGLPLIGSLLDLRSDVLMKMKRFADEYGSIYTMNVSKTCQISIYSFE